MWLLVTPEQALEKIALLCRESDAPDFEVPAQKILGVMRTIEVDRVPTKSPAWGVPMPWRLRWQYAWVCLRGDVRVTGLVDVSKLETEGYMEGVIRVRTDHRAAWGD